MFSKKLKIPYRNTILDLVYFLRPGTQESVFYIHGLGCSKRDFQEALKIANLKNHTLASFDLPGHGNSSYPKNIHLNMNDLVKITHSVVNKLNLRHPVIIGHSMGGLIGLLYAEKHMKHVKCFINVEGNLASEDCFFSRAVSKLTFQDFEKGFLKNFKNNLAKLKNKGSRKYRETLSLVLPKVFHNYCPSLVNYSDHGNLIQRFLKLKIPKLFIYGAQNSQLSYIPKLKKAGCPVVEIPRSGHSPYYDNPIIYYDVLANFVDSLVTYL